MGNQSLVQSAQSNDALQKLLLSNKHFQTQSFRDLPKQKFYQLFKNLSIDPKNIISNTAQQSSSYSLNSMVFNDDFSFQKISHRLAWRMSSKYPHIFNINKLKVEQHKNLCSFARKIYLSQDGYTFTLKDLMRQKAQKKQSFSEEEILIILTKITQAVIWMHDNEFKNIPFDSESITFVEDTLIEVEKPSSNLEFTNYVCKIIDQDIVQNNSYKKLLQALTEAKNQPDDQKKIIHLQIYLSPQLLEQAKSQNFYPINFNLKSDVFTLGMLMMELCCQEEMYFCYDLDQLAFDYESLIHRIAKISYSNELKLLLAEMLEYDENNRIGFVSLKEKLSKLIFKPLEETRKLKRRSSSTMLKELLSCSRASISVSNRQQKQKQDFNKISKLSQSNKQIEDNLKVEEASNQNQSTDQSLRKSNSLVNLKCRTNSFLTSKKLTLMRTNSNTKLKTDSKQHTNNEISHQMNKVNYRNILKNRVKTQFKTLQCPQNQELNTSMSSNTYKFQEGQKSKIYNLYEKKNQENKIQLNYICNQNQQTQDMQNINIQNCPILDGKIQTFKFQQLANNLKENTMLSYVQKKVINLDKINISSALHQEKQQLSKSNTKILAKNSSSVSQLSKTKKSTTNSSVIKALDLKPKPIDKENQNSTNKPNDSLKIKESSISITNKNWIMGKLKSNKTQPKTSQSSMLNLFIVKKEKPKSSDSKPQSSLTKPKTFLQGKNDTSPLSQTVETKRNQFNIQESYQKFFKPLSAINLNSDVFSETKELNLMPSNQRSKNDTIIKRLELTEEKQVFQEHFRQENKTFSTQKLTFPQQNDEYDLASSRINPMIKDQMRLINIAIQKCQLSRSRWQDQSQNFDFREYETERQTQIGKFSSSDNLLLNQNQTKKSQTEQDRQNSEIKAKISQNNQKAGQFKKKSTVIDIDLGFFPNCKSQAINQSKQSTNFSKQTKIAPAKNEKKPSSKLQKLKQLTIFTEQVSEKQQPNKDQRMKQTNQEKSQDKENQMLNSNLQLSVERGTIYKANDLIKNSKKPGHSQSLSQTNQISISDIIPRVDQVNLAKVTPSLITPNNLNQLNRFSGKGMTLQSIQHSFQSVLHKKDFSTLSKPFQQIQLNYDAHPTINSPNLPKDLKFAWQQQTQAIKQSNQKSSKKNPSKKSQNSSCKKDNCLYSINAEQLTFRLKPRISNHQKGTKVLKPQHDIIQKISFIEKQDGSFVMREQNPMKNIQASSMIGQQDKSKMEQRNTVEELFKQSSKFERYEQSFSNESDESFCEQNQASQKMNSSCNSINLSQIQCQEQPKSSFIYAKALKSNERQRKYKHISILQSGDDSYDPTKNLKINIQNLKQIIDNDKPKNKLRNSDYDTYRRYLSSNPNSSTVELGDDFFYEGQVNEDGQFQGNGMISKKNYKTGQNDLIYTGSFLNGLYHGFGTLYQIENTEEKRLKLPNHQKRISFGQRSQLKFLKNDKYFELSQLPIKYEGQFVDGKENGFGTYSYENGDRFSGCIKDGSIEGYGTYHFSQNGDSISGIWKNNTFSDC